MHDAEIRTELVAFIINRFLPGERSSALTDELSLKGSGIINSVNLLELVTHLEDRYGLSLSAQEVATRLDTLGSIVSLILEKKG